MQDIHDIRPPVQVGFDPMVIKNILMILGGIFVLAILFFLIKKYFKTRKQVQDVKYLPEPVPPYDDALRQLDLLLKSAMPDPRLFYFDLTAILKKYIGKSFHVNAVEMTTQEFIKTINRLELDNGVKKDVARFHEISDPVRYAGVAPAKDRAKQDILFVKEIITQIENNLRKYKPEEQDNDNV